MISSVRRFVELTAEACALGPVIEFGSKQVPWQHWTGVSQDLRPLFSNRKYVGCDIMGGLGVDVIASAIQPPFHESAGILLMCEMLEHCTDPFEAILAAKQVLKPDGVLLITVPFSHPVHHMPDYWRFTMQGMELMLGRAGLYKSIYYQGDLALPRTIFALASKDQSMLTAVVLGVEAKLGSVPGREVGEKMYKWGGARQYSQMRRQDRLREETLEKQFGF